MEENEMCIRDRFCSENILPDTLRFITDRMSVVQIYNYIRRQMREAHMKSGEVLTTCLLYTSRCV